MGIYFCKICARPQNSFQPRYLGISCNACLVFFQRSIYLEPNFKCKKGHKCFNGSPKQILRCRRCRYKKCISVGMPAPIIRSPTAAKMPLETALIYALTVDKIISAITLNPKIIQPYLKKQCQKLFIESFENAKNQTTSTTNLPPKIKCLANLFQNNLFNVNNELRYFCFISVCKFGFKNLPENEREQMQKLQNNGFRKLETEKINLSILFEWIKISKQSLNVIEIFSFV